MVCFHLILVLPKQSLMQTLLSAGPEFLRAESTPSSYRSLRRPQFLPLLCSLSSLKNPVYVTLSQAQGYALPRAGATCYMQSGNGLIFCHKHL